jgi:cell division protein FtsB
LRPSYGRSHGHIQHTFYEGRPILRHVVASDAGPLRRLVIAGLAALSGLAAYAVFTEAAQGSALDARVRSLTTQNTTLQQQIGERQRQIGEADNTAWLQEQARRLGFVYPGETVFILTTPGAPLPAGGGLNAPLPTYAPSPSASPSPGASSAPSAAPTPTPTPRPTPVTFPLASPSPTHH